MSTLLETILLLALVLVLLPIFAFALIRLMTGGTGEDRYARENIKERNKETIWDGRVILSKRLTGDATDEEVVHHIHRLDKEIAYTQKRIKRYKRDSLMHSFLRDIEDDLRTFEAQRENLVRVIRIGNA